MSTTVIQVENLSKGYIIRHQYDRKYDRGNGWSYRAEFAFRNPIRWLPDKFGNIAIPQSNLKILTRTT